MNRYEITMMTRMAIPRSLENIMRITTIEEAEEKLRTDSRWATVLRMTAEDFGWKGPDRTALDWGRLPGLQAADWLRESFPEGAREGVVAAINQTANVYIP